MGSVVRVWTSQAPRLVRGRMTMGGSQVPHLSTREFPVGPSSAAVLSSLLQGWGALGLGGRGCCSHWGTSLLQARPYGAAATACEGDRGPLVFVCPQLGGLLPPRAALTPRRASWPYARLLPGLPLALSHVSLQRTLRAGEAHVHTFLEHTAGRPCRTRLPRGASSSPETARRRCPSLAGGLAQA